MNRKDLGCTVLLVILLLITIAGLMLLRADIALVMLGG